MQERQGTRRSGTQARLARAAATMAAPCTQTRAFNDKRLVYLGSDKHEVGALAVLLLLDDVEQLRVRLLQRQVQLRCPLPSHREHQVHHVPVQNCDRRTV